LTRANQREGEGDGSGRET
jgi:hypothetical protein